MSNLANQFISSSYQSVLNVGTGSGDYLTTTLKPITDGFGTVSPISLSTNQVGINGTVYVTGSIIPQGSGSWSLGSPTNPFLHGYFSSQSIYLDGHPILQLDETNNTTIKGPGENSIVFLNNITLDSDPTTQTYVGGTFTLIGRGIDETTTNTFYNGDKHWLRTNGKMVFQNVTGNTDTTSSGSYSIAILNGGEYNLYSDSGSIKLATDEGSINLIVQDNVTNQNKKYINLNGEAIAIVSQDGNDIGINNTVSGSIFIDTRNYESGSEVYRGNVLIFGNEILNNGTIINEGSLTTVGNGLYNQIQADYSGSGVQLGGWTLNVSSSVDGTFAGNVLSDLNSGSFNYAPSLGYAVSSFQSETPGMVVPVYYSGDINDAGSDVLMISTSGTTTIYRNVAISGSLHQSGTFYADAITFTNSPSIVETTGSYIMTYDVTGSVTYDTYPNVAAALQPYLSGVTGSFGQVELLTNQTLGSASDTVITFNNDEFDPSGWYNNEYFYYQPNIAGIYQISYSVNFEPATGGTGQINVQVSKDNGEDINQLAINQHELNLLSNTTLTGTVFAQLDGDLDKVYLTAYSSVGQDVNGGNGTYLNIKLL